MIWTALVALAFGACATAHSHSQSPFSTYAHGSSGRKNDGATTPSFEQTTLGDTFAKFAASEVDMHAAAAFTPAVRSFDALSESAYSVLTHPAYPRHSVRVKKSKFCDGGVECVLFLLLDLIVSRLLMLSLL
jgi:hypothetical protein